MTASKFDLGTGYMKIFSQGSENSNSAKWVEILIKYGIFHPGLKIFIF